MDLQIALLLMQDGLVNGAVYGLMALALVLVFSVTRVIFIPQGELVAFAALTMAMLNTGRTPLTLWLLLGLAALTLATEIWRSTRGIAVGWAATLVWTLVLPGLAALWVLLGPRSLTAQAAATLLLVGPLGPLLYRLAYRPLADASVLLLLIVSVALHGVLVGLGLVCVLFLFFERTMIGRALRATAMNRVGARLMGIPTELCGDLSFALAGLIGAVSGLLIAPITTVYYDTGFLIGLKGFVAAIIGGLASYPLALAGAVLVGQLEAFSSFWASAFKEVIVFTLIIPVLWWRSLRSRHVEDEE